MIQIFEKILTKMVVPQFDDILNVEVSRYNMSYLIHVIYYLRSPLTTTKNTLNIREETFSMSRMLGIPEFDIHIDFKHEGNI